MTKKRKAKLKYSSCQLCKEPTRNTSSGDKRKFCDPCRVEKANIVGNLTLEEMSYSKDPQNRYRKVRHHAHEVAKRSLGSRICSKCPYDRHVELAHIKAISSFSLDTKLNVINDPSNLMWLCPNCHWEFDNFKKV